VTTDNNVVPEFDLTYMITPHFGVEAIAGITQHDISIDGADPVLTSLGVTDNLKIFDVWVLPPTLTLQYHFTPARKIRPYAGIGVNYTAMLWNDSTKRLESAVGSVEIDTRSSWGWAAQVGVDWDLGNNWFANLDLKYIDMETTASLYVRSLAATLRVNTDVNPWVVGVGLGYRF
jgi:outer membrane protein